MRTRQQLALVTLVFAMVLGGCGGDDDGAGTASPSTASGGSATTTAAAGGSTSSGSSTTPDPCTLVTVQEVSTAIGSPVETPKVTNLPQPIGGRTCIFNNTDAPPIKTVQITVKTNGDLAKNLRDQGMSVEKLYDDTKNLAKSSGSGVEDVSGLGDKAYKTASAYYVLKKGVSLDTNLGLNSSPSAQAQAALKTLTEKAVSRL